MLSVGPNDKLNFYAEAVDMRKGFDGLSGLVENELERDPTNGEIFIFINKARNKIKLLQWEAGGFAIYYKRLEKGTFEIPSHKAGDKSISIPKHTLEMMLCGISLEQRIQRKRYA
ncbi:IS66 family insertion sequence element accessory protein TnpB [Persicobacter diffluens]|uniref:Transposase n=1 Tax=Persicobacter diffluens TaxID=981 RepID=A0AAN5APH4_9BACT|nr:transposase [Persicobacter diffluens]